MHDPAKLHGEMAELIVRHAPADGEYATPIASLFIGRRSTPTPPTHVAQRPIFALVVQGEKCLTIGDETFRYGVGNCLLASMDLPVISCVTRASVDVPLLGLGLLIDGARLTELMRRVPLPRTPAAGDGLLSVAVSKAAPELLDALARLLRLLDRPADIPALAPLLEEEILYRLLTGPDGPRLLHIASAESRSNRVAKAVEWIRNHFDAPLSIPALADHVGMSGSSLHHQFKAVTALTPLQYQKQLRLHEARRLLLVEKVGVATAGHRVGYQSPSQFSREYARLYGRSPLRDLDESVPG
jgi:AraC-like DNA-binding protein